MHKFSEINMLELRKQANLIPFIIGPLGVTVDIKSAIILLSIFVLIGIFKNS